MSTVTPVAHVVLLFSAKALAVLVPLLPWSIDAYLIITTLRSEVSTIRNEVGYDDLQVSPPVSL